MAGRARKVSKKPKAKVIGLTTRYKRFLGNMHVFTCECEGQLFMLLENGDVICHGCRSKQPHARFKVV